MTYQSRKVAIVTGASRGIGADIAKKLALDGFAVVVNYAGNQQKADKVVNEIKATGREAIAIQGDVSRAKDVADQRSNHSCQWWNCLVSGS